MPYNQPFTTARRPDITHLENTQLLSSWIFMFDQILPHRKQGLLYLLVTLRYNIGIRRINNFTLAFNSRKLLYFSIFSK